MTRRITQIGLWIGALTMGLPFGLLLVTSLMTPQQTLAYPPKGIDKFVPKVAKGTWKP